MVDNWLVILPARVKRTPPKILILSIYWSFYPRLFKNVLFVYFVIYLNTLVLDRKCPFLADKRECLRRGFGRRRAVIIWTRRKKTEHVLLACSTCVPRTWILSDFELDKRGSFLHFQTRRILYKGAERFASLIDKEVLTCFKLFRNCVLWSPTIFSSTKIAFKRLVRANFFQLSSLSSAKIHRNSKFWTENGWVKHIF